jgi:ferredoxin
VNDSLPRLVVDLTRCRGHGQCASVAPDVFELRDERSYVLIDRPGPEHADVVEDAILMCPEAAIDWSTA